MTAADNTGAKLWTNVYAGQAVVANQIEGEVSWFNTEPVTGSNEWVRADGTSTGRTEYEPLGQQLATQYSTQSPWPIMETMVSADQPQWQCQMADAMGQSFFSMPVHCQMAQLENTSISLREILESYENVPGSAVTDLAAGAATLESLRGTSSVSGELLADSTTSTDKPDDPKTDGDGGLPAASVPTSDGGDPDVDLENNIVTVRTNADPFDEGLGAEFRASNDDEKEKFQNRAFDRAEELLHERRCWEFVNGLMPKIAPDGRYVNQVGIVFTLAGKPVPNNPLGAYSAALAGGRVSASNRKVQRGRFIEHALVTNNESLLFHNAFYTSKLDEAAITIIHESFHLYQPGFSDRAIATAITGKFYGNTQEGQDKASATWDERLNNACLPISFAPPGQTTLR